MKGGVSTIFVVYHCIQTSLKQPTSRTSYYIKYDREGRREVRDEVTKDEGGDKVPGKWWRGTKEVYYLVESVAEHQTKLLQKLLAY